MSFSGTQITAVVTGSVLSGIMLSISAQTVPALLDSTTNAPQLFHQWTRLYFYGSRLMPTLALGTAALYGLAGARLRSAGSAAWSTYALAAVSTLSIVPFTFLFMARTNNELFRLEAASRMQPLVATVAEAKALIVRWSWLHLTRSLLPLAGAVLGVFGMYAA
ncbi:hypothetical protein B0T22DRAFT_529861 [Podospora appendiculata]|uniref:DUF1772-domain-containing protein n=1 Tax=Podospora appendiculata TaxID=314037 RepID=A0AAE0X6L6_9PEZI|nr:hypothetical protein B0T22DRAFT_529861 [Podospora appendiculata]